jgi:acetate---CoA ligase (ADP-forming)
MTCPEELQGGLQIRIAQPGDAGAVRAFLEQLSPDSRWLRYHTPTPIVRSWMVDAVVSSDHEKHEALLAWFDGNVVGIAEWARLSGSTEAEVAIVVGDDCRRRGIAKALLDDLTRNGRSHGITAFDAAVLSVNRPTMAMIQRLAAQPTYQFDGSTIEVSIPIARSAQITS